MFKMLSDKQSATEMESEVSKKCDLTEEFSTISYTTLPICRLQLVRFLNQIMIVLTILLPSYKNQIDYLLREIYIHGKKCMKRI